MSENQWEREDEPHMASRRMELSHDDHGRVPVEVSMEPIPGALGFTVRRRYKRPPSKKPEGRRLIDSPGFSAEEALLVQEAILDRVCRARNTVELLTRVRKDRIEGEIRHRRGTLRKRVSRRQAAKACGIEPHAIRQAREHLALLERAHEKLRLARGRRAR